MEEMIILEYKTSILNSEHVKTEGMHVKKAFSDYIHTEQ